MISLLGVVLVRAPSARAQLGGAISLSGPVSAQQSYPLQVAQRPTVVPPWGQNAPVQTMWLRPGGGGPDPVLHGALAVAAVPATSLGAGCRGAFPATPQQQLWVGSNVPLVDVLVRAAGPATIAIRAPTGAVFCTDNLSGGDARITMRSVVAGTYLIYVGTTGAPVPYTIGASAQGPLAPAAVSLPPGAPQGAPWLAQSGAANSGAAQTTAITTPSVNTNSSAAAPTQGLPVLAVSAGTGAEGLVIAADTSANASAGGVPVGWVRVDPNAPQLAQRMQNGAGAPGPGRGTINIGPTSPDLQRANGTTPGRAALRFLRRSCLGFGDRSPSLVFTVDPGVRFLRVFARSTGDTTLAVRAPNGRVTCVDDTYGAHPGVDVDQPVAGQWRVFVGSSVPNSPLPYELTVTTRNDARPQ